MKQEYTKDDLEKMMPVFHLKPETSTRAKSILTMYCNNEERICDDQLEIETTDEIREKIGDNTLLLGQVSGYVIVGKYCACNIPGDYLINNNKIPVFYLSIIFSRQFITGCLFNIFLYFDIDEETKKKLDTPKKYYKAFMDGKYTLQFVPTDDDFLYKIKEFVEKDKLLKYQNDIERCESLEEKDNIMEKIINEIETEMKECKSFLTEQPFGDRVPTQKMVYKKMNEMCDLPILKKLLNYGLLYREKERIAVRDVDEKIYTIPKNIIKLDDIKNNPEKLDDVLTRIKESADSSDDERI